jgi:hypothetical protein
MSKAFRMINYKVKGYSKVEILVLEGVYERTQDVEVVTISDFRSNRKVPRIT